MPNTSILHANALTQQKWPDTLFKYILANMVFGKYIGKPGSGMPIIMDQNLNKNEPGDQITLRLRPRLTGAGGYDDSDMEGNEEAMSFFNMPVQIHERSHATRSSGLMTDKRAAINIIEEGGEALGDWATEQEEDDIIYGLCGLGNQGGYVGEGATNIATVNEKAPSTNRILYGGQTVAGVVDWVANDSEFANAGGKGPIDHLFGTKVIEKMRLAALTATPKFRPVKINGKGYYILFIHYLQEETLRMETGSTGWLTMQSQANLRGPRNPAFEREGQGEDRMFDGALGVWHDVIIYSSERLPTRVAGEVFSGSGGTYILNAAVTSGTYRVARAVLMGQQAGVFAWGRQWTRRTKDFDYNRKPGIGMDCLYGFSKTQFRDPGLNQSANNAQEDYAVVVADTVVYEA